MRSSPSPTRVAFRSLIAGGAEFEDFGKGTDPKAIFERLQDDARHESGHGGYSGTIAEKSGFKIRSSTPMTRSQAQAFAQDDMDKNDKWGPAFAVPVAESKVKSEKEVALKVQAKDQYAANEAVKQQIRAKSPNAEVSFTTTTKLKDGNLPTFAQSPGTKKTYQVTHAGGGSIVSGPSKKDALDALKAKILRDPYVLDAMKPGAAFVLQEIKDLKVFTVASASTKLPMWEVKAKVKIVETGTVVGYLFYGWASS